MSTELAAIATAVVLAGALTLAQRATRARPASQVRAVIYIGEVEDPRRSEACCFAYCERRNYEVVSFVHDPDGSRWDSVWAVFHNLRAEVLVVCAISKLAPGRVPRWEYAGGAKTRSRRPT